MIFAIPFRIVVAFFFDYFMLFHLKIRPGQTRLDFMQLLNISEAKAQFSSVVERVVTKGEEILIGKAGKPVAKIVRYEPALKHKRLGLFVGKIKIADDFDEWPEDMEKSFGMLDS